VLVVEENMTNQAAARGFFTKFGIDIASDGQEAVTILETADRPGLYGLPDARNGWIFSDPADSRCGFKCQKS